MASRPRRTPEPHWCASLMCCWALPSTTAGPPRLCPPQLNAVSGVPLPGGVNNIQVQRPPLCARSRPHAQPQLPALRLALARAAGQPHRLHRRGLRHGQRVSGRRLVQLWRKHCVRQHCHGGREGFQDRILPGDWPGQLVCGQHWPGQQAHRPGCAWRLGFRRLCGCGPPLGHPACYDWAGLPAMSLPALESMPALGGMCASAARSLPPTDAQRNLDNVQNGQGLTLADLTLVTDLCTGVTEAGGACAAAYGHLHLLPHPCVRWLALARLSQQATLGSPLPAPWCSGSRCLW